MYIRIRNRNLSFAGSIVLLIGCLTTAPALCQQPEGHIPARGILTFLDASEAADGELIPTVARRLGSLVGASLNRSITIRYVQSGADALRAIAGGDAQLAAVSTTELAHLSPKFAIFDLPFFFQTIDEAAAYQKTVAGQILLGSLSGQDLVGIGFWNIGANQLFARDYLALLRSPPLPPLLSWLHWNLPRIWTGSSALATDVLRHLHVHRVEPLALIEPPMRSTDHPRVGLRPDDVVPSAFSTAYDSGRFDFVDFPNVLAKERVGRPSAEFYSAFPPEFSSINYRVRVSVVIMKQATWDTLPLQVQSQFVGAVRETADLTTQRSAAEDQQARIAMGGPRLRAISFSPDQRTELEARARRSWDAISRDMGESFLHDSETILLRVRQTRSQDLPPDRRLPTHQELTGIRTAIFATDRELESKAPPNCQFGSRSGTLRFGRGIMRTDIRGKDVCQGNLTEIEHIPSKDEFQQVIRAELEGKVKKEVLVYVHGYNTPFPSSLSTLSIMAEHSKFEGLSISFSWPSDGLLMRYPRDGDVIHLSRDRFLALLSILAEVETVTRIHVLVHSMGARLVSEALEWAESRSSIATPRLAHVVFAAPDIFTDLFARRVPSMRAVSERLTVYASESDNALNCARTFNGTPRAGQGGKDIFVKPDIDTIDVTNAQLPTKSWFPNSFRPSCTSGSGHDYISTNQAVMADFHLLVTLDAPPAKRPNLVERKADGIPYWIFRK